MGIDDNIYTILNTLWVAATIAKPTLHTNKEPAVPTIRHTFINGRFKGKFDPVQHDNTCDETNIFFKITSYEALEADSVNVLKVIKKLLHEADVSGGNYHIDTFDIDEINGMSTLVLEGHLYKQIEHDAFI